MKGGSFDSLGGFFCDGEESHAPLCGCPFTVLSSLLVQLTTRLVADS
jgi:hypothetical protein